MGTESNIDHFIDCEHKFSVSPTTPLVGKKMVLQFLAHREGATENDPIWDEMWIIVDAVKLTRE